LRRIRLENSVLYSLLLHGMSFRNIQNTRTATATTPDIDYAICEPEIYHVQNMRDVKDYVNAFFCRLSSWVLPALEQKLNDQAYLWRIYLQDIGISGIYHGIY
jgi:hypothetical protein